MLNFKITKFLDKRNAIYCLLSNNKTDFILVKSVPSKTNNSYVHLIILRNNNPLKSVMEFATFDFPS